jgi:hypothetical protein
MDEKPRCRNMDGEVRTGPPVRSGEGPKREARAGRVCLSSLGMAGPEEGAPLRESSRARPCLRLRSNARLTRPASPVQHGDGADCAAHAVRPHGRRRQAAPDRALQHLRLLHPPERPAGARHRDLARLHLRRWHCRDPQLVRRAP